MPLINSWVTTPLPLSVPQLSHCRRRRQGFLDQRSATNSARRSQPCRIVLYSHDTMGLGHKRRNLLIAQILSNSELDTEILLISGMRDASDVPLPNNVDYLTLPALHKRLDGSYEARNLGLSLHAMTELRSHLICTAIQQFQPDIFIVDNVPRGAVRELDPALEYIQSQPQIRCVLGLRDVLDTPAAVKRDWNQKNNEATIRQYYDAIWIYGDPVVYDPRTEYHFSADIRAKMCLLGYLDQRTRLYHLSSAQRLKLDALDLPRENFVLGLVGGGQDGAALALAFAESSFPEGMNGILVTGPFMPPEIKEKLHRLAEVRRALHVVEYLEEPTLLMEQASRVVAMGGYNTTCEILSFQKPALIIPRVVPRQEQWIRAERLRHMGVVDVLHPTNVNSQSLSAWFHQPLEKTAPPVPINLNGADMLIAELEQLLARSALSYYQVS